MAAPDFVKAVHYFKKALEQDPAREQSLYELVRIKEQQGDLTEALAYLQKYENLSLKNRTLLAIAVDVAHKAGRFELESDYKLRLASFSDTTGEKNEYDNSNG